MNDTPSGERTHIGIFGCRNAGKSSLINAITDSSVSVVSDIAGTTTDAVRKSMEILPLGPVVLIDTPGYDDEGELGALRVAAARRILNMVDIAVLVFDSTVGFGAADKELLSVIRGKEIPYIVVSNKSDIGGYSDAEIEAVSVSSTTGEGINELKEAIGRLMPESMKKPPLVSDLISAGEVVVLVCPIDESAPRGRLILPQQLAIRDIIDAGGIAMVTRESELKQTLSKLDKNPAMVITDSQVFSIVSDIVPEDVPLTSFSILMARYKGFLDTAIEGVRAIDNLNDGDIVLMAEGCTHHRQCKDIGTVKIPGWLRDYTGRELCFETSSGSGFPEDLSRYALIIHCGGCMITEREVSFRMKCAIDAGVPFTNYGTVIAQMTGVLSRSLTVF